MAGVRRVVWKAGLLLGGIAVCRVGWGQFDLEESHTTASLRGVDSLGGGVAWASGSGGTVLRTEDGGYLWQPCATPKGAEKLDFRGVVGLDASTAVVMASGPGAASKVYRTTDGCQTWKLVFENPDKDGFFDSLRKVTAKQMYLMGDPVAGKFAMFTSQDAGVTWFIADDPGLEAEKGAGAFAASNTSLASVGGTMFFGTGGTAGATVYTTGGACAGGATACPLAWKKMAVPLAGGTSGAGGVLGGGPGDGRWVGAATVGAGGGGRGLYEAGEFGGDGGVVRRWGEVVCGGGDAWGIPVGGGV